MTTCLVSAKDFRRHFDGRDAIDAPVQSWDGVERRMGTDRRQRAHDRRWDHARGRRFRLSDRRTTTR